MEEIVKPMSRIKISVQGIIEIEVESEELNFFDLKKESYDIFKFAKEQMFGSKPDDNDVQ